MNEGPLKAGLGTLHYSILTTLNKIRHTIEGNWIESGTGKIRLVGGRVEVLFTEKVQCAYEIKVSVQ